MAQTHQLSPVAFDRLKAEHDDLTTRGRIEIAQSIERARELGDLSENGDYHAAKDQQGLMESRIRSPRIHPGERRDRGRGRGGRRVAPASIVTIRYEGDDDDMAETYLVGHIEEKGERDVISPDLPPRCRARWASGPGTRSSTTPRAVRSRCVVLKAEVG